MNGVGALPRGDAGEMVSFCHGRVHKEGRCLGTRKRALIGHWVCWHPDLRPSSFQSCEKYTFVVCADQSLVFVITRTG